MNIFYEESGQFKVATIVQKNDSTYQVDTQHGKRTKVKANNVFVEFNEPMDSFLNAAQAEAAEIDTDLLWETCGEVEFSAEAIAEDYYGHKPTATELAATLIALAGIHAAAAIVMGRLERVNLVGAMITGIKRTRGGRVDLR